MPTSESLCRLAPKQKRNGRHEPLVTRACLSVLDPPNLESQNSLNSY
jgi:hypothetical protein